MRHFNQILNQFYFRDPVAEVINRQRVAFVRELLNTGANVNFTDHKNRNALHLACQQDDMETANLLITNGCDYEQSDKSNKLPIDHISDRYVKNQFSQLIDLKNCR